jgi:dephospho-CoA kinase
VADLFRGWGVPLLDADQLARELVEPGQPALAEIRARFGPESLHPDGSLNRAWLRSRVFSNPAARRQLEAILHPLIRLRTQQWLARQVSAPFCVVVMPLLLESGQQDLFDRIIVVDSPEKEQLKRVAARDGLSDNAVMEIMATQADRATRLAAADHVILNDADLDTLEARTRELHNYLTDNT